MEEVAQLKDIKIEHGMPIDQLICPSDLDLKTYIPVKRKNYLDREKMKIAEEGEKWYS